MPKEWDQDPEQELELDPKLRWELERIEAEADEEYPDWRRGRRARPRCWCAESPC